MCRTPNSPPPSRPWPPPSAAATTWTCARAIPRATRPPTPPPGAPAAPYGRRCWRSCCSASTPTRPTSRPLRLSGARVTGLLHLAFGEIDLPVTFRDCFFDQTPDLYQARTRFLSFAGSTLPGLIASNLQVEGDLRLTGCHVTGELRLRSARISSNFSLNGARLEPAAGSALNAEHLDVGSNLLLRDGFACDGEIILTAARIGAAVNLEGARLRAPAGWRSAGRTWSPRWACSRGR